MSPTSELDRWHARLEALGRLQARYAWWLVLSSVFLLALHMSLRDCGVVPGDLAEAWGLALHGTPDLSVGTPPPVVGSESGPSQPVADGARAVDGAPVVDDASVADGAPGLDRDPVANGVVGVTGAESESSPLCADQIVTVPLLGIPLSALVIWATGPLFLAFLTLVFMGSFIAAAEAGKRLGYIQEYGESPLGFVDTVPNGIDLAFTFHPAVQRRWTGAAKRLASFKYQAFVALILVQAAFLWLYSFAVWRGGSEDGFLGQRAILAAGALAFGAAVSRVWRLLRMRLKATPRQMGGGPWADLASRAGVAPDDMQELAEGIRAWVGARKGTISDEDLRRLIQDRFAAESLAEGEAPAHHVLDGTTVDLLRTRFPELDAKRG